MKIIHLKNLKHECVLVELARYVAHFEYACGSDGIYLQWHDGQIDEFEGCIGEHGQIKLSDNPRDSFKRLGKFTDLKEGDFEGLVHRSGHYSDLYKSYNPKDVRPYSFGRESFISAIKAEGWYTENTYGTEDNSIKYGQYLEWRQFQEKVINLSNCYLFVKS